METEELICESCKSIWTRQKTRGRKPKFCPPCIPVLIIVEQQHNFDSQDNQDLENIFTKEEPPLTPTRYKPGTKWLCPSCLVSIRIGVGHNDPPTHACKKKLKKIIPLQKV
jgi:hypothetical protein